MLSQGRENPASQTAIDHFLRGHYITDTRVPRSPLMSATLLATIEEQLEALLAQCGRLQAENQHLRHQAAHWQDERSRLIEKNALACSRIEAMITRLKRLEIPAP